jgi:lipopolysaccharide export system protein LptA
MAQKKPSRIELVHYDKFHDTLINKVQTIKAYKAIFKQDYSVLTSDSAYFYPAQNMCDAFGHVVITQGDTLHIYGDKLHYDGNTKVAIMTDHVKMVDKDATLTTNYLTYNTATRIGTYTGGGKLVNQDNTLTSKNGYYFANSRDAYFRYDVVMITSDAIIKTDTLRYNSGTGISYFYGPTHIYAKKDKDVLYTENGTYNTKTEQAFFGKKNLYTSGTKSLKGDSLFYDRLTGYGKALKHITFNDDQQKVTIKGDKAVYTKPDERTVVTENAYVVLETGGDTTKLKDSVLKKDTIISKPAVAKKPTLAETVGKPVPHTIKRVETDAKTGKPLDTLARLSPKRDTVKNKRDSIFMAADTIETMIPTYKALKVLQEQRRLYAMRDTSVKIVPSVVYTKVPKILTAPSARIMIDSTSYLHHDYFPKPPRDTSIHVAKPTLAKKTNKKALPPKIIPIDSVNISQAVILADTAKVRILIAYHHAKIYKSDLQARADSIFYSYSDSTARMYRSPMVWSNGSQLSGDTINLQLKNKKVDNIAFSPHAFVVSIVKTDSVHFNQVGGRKMRGFFKDGKIDKIFVDGNAETIYYERDSLDHPTDITSTISSRIRVNFLKGELAATTLTVKTVLKAIPLATAKEEDKILRGFLWKPKDRPVSKESIIPSSPPPPKPGPKKPAAKPGVKKKGAVTQAVKPAAPKLTAPEPDDVKPISDTVKLKADTVKKVFIKPNIKTAN